MKQTHKIIKNSFYLIMQPLILNFISVFAVGYIARTLGKSDYGQFIFAFSYIQIFSPIYMAGLSTYAIRLLAENKSGASSIVGKIFMLRILLGLLATLCAVVIITMLKYGESEKLLVYVSSVTLLSNAVLLTSMDIFQAFEKMELVALVNLVSGLCITFLSVLVLYIGYNVVAVAAVYAFGNILGMLLAINIVCRKFFIPKLEFDLVFFKSCLKKGFHFFYPTVAYMVGSKMGIIFLSGFAGVVSVGVYAAADNLVSRLSVICDATCSSIYPSLVSSFKKSKEDMALLFRKFFAYLLILSIPIVIGCVLLSRTIIILIYGEGYSHSIIILQIATVGLVMIIQNALMAYALATLHKEKYSALIQTSVNVATFVLSLVLISFYNEVGFALAILIGSFLLFGINIVMIQKYLCKFLIDRTVLLKIILANLIMAVSIIIMKDWNLFVVSVLSLGLYLISLFYLKIINFWEFVKLIKVLTKKESFMSLDQSI